MHERAAELIRELGLQVHPEGGWYRQTFKSANGVTRLADGERRSAVTAIYFLLAEGQVSRWHQVASEEIWTHLEGAGVLLWCHEGEGADGTRLGPLADGAAPFVVIPAHAWQAAECLGEYALVACFVAPGFEFADFVLMADQPGAAAALQEHHPALFRLI